MQIFLQLFACVFKLVFGMHTLERCPDPPKMALDDIEHRIYLLFLTYRFEMCVLTCKEHFSDILTCS